MAALLGIPPRTARNYLSTGKIRAQQNPITGTWKITREDLLAFMHSHNIDPKKLLSPIKILTVGLPQDVVIRLNEFLSARREKYILSSTTSFCEAVAMFYQQPPQLAIFSSRVLCNDAQSAFRFLRDHPIHAAQQPRLVVFVENLATIPKDSWGADAVINLPYTNENLLVILNEIRPLPHQLCAS